MRKVVQQFALDIPSTVLPVQRGEESLQLIMFKYSLDRMYKMSIYSIYYGNKEHYYFPEETVLKVEWVLGGSPNSLTCTCSVSCSELCTTLRSFQLKNSFLNIPSFVNA